MKIYSYVKFIWDGERQEYKQVYSEHREYNGDVSLCGGGSKRTKTVVTTTVRYAPYIETKHQSFLNAVAGYRATAIGNSPFDNFDNYVVENAFFGTGNVIDNFPSLYDMYGKFMGGLDVEALYSQMYEDTVNSPAVDDVISYTNTLAQTDINDNSLPRFNKGKLNINSAMTESFAVGKSIINDIKDRAITKFKTQLKYSLIPAANVRWLTHLGWNKGVIDYYSEIMKFYYTSKIDTTEKNYAMATSNKLWPFTILDFERAALGALQGAKSSSGSETIKGAGTSQGTNALGGALSGAAMGAMLGSSIKPPTSAIQTTGSGVFSGMESGGQSPVMSGGGGGWGAGIGAALGIASSFIK